MVSAMMRCFYHGICTFYRYCGPSESTIYSFAVGLDKWASVGGMLRVSVGPGPPAHELFLIFVHNKSRDVKGLRVLV